jgi:predicted nucleotidyltransferase
MAQFKSEQEHLMEQDPVLRKLVCLAQESSGICALWLYGSRARGDHRVDSDYDVALSYNMRLADTLDNRLRPELISSEWSQLLGEDISVVDIDLIPTPLAAAIADEGKLLLDKAPKDTAWMYHKIWSKWDEWQYNRSANHH